MVKTRRGTAADDQMEETPTSSPMATDQEPSSPVGERGDRVTRLEEKLERLTAMVERLAEAEMRATTRTNPVNDLPRAPPVASTYGMDQGEPSIREEPVRQRPGKEVIRDTPDTSNETNENTAWTANQAALPPLKVDMKTDLPTYDGVVDGDKLDGWIDRLESYFDIYGYDDSRRLAIARLKLASHALVWWNAHLRTYGSRGLTWEAFKVLLKEQFYPVGYDEKRWQNWLFLKQADKGVQDYTTEFRRQALGLGISLNNAETLRKYLAGLRDELRKEVTLIPITNISEACKRAVVFEDLNRGRRGGNNPNKQQAKGSGGAKGGSSGGSKGGDKGNGSGGGTNNSSKGKGDKKKSNVTCTHCSKTGHTHAKCWKLHPELAPKKKGKGKTAMVVVADGVTNVVAQEADPTLSLMVRAKEKGESSKKVEVVPTGVSDKKREELFHFRI
jgi:hypothetical protein